MSATEPDLTDFDTIDFDAAADLLDVLEDHRDLMHELYRKFAGDGRIRDEEKEKVRVSYANAWIRAVNAEIRLAKAIEAAETDRRLEAIEEELGLQS